MSVHSKWPFDSQIGHGMAAWRREEGGGGEARVVMDGGHRHTGLTRKPQPLKEPVLSGQLNP